MKYQPYKYPTRTAALLILSCITIHANAALVSNAAFQFSTASYFGLDSNTDDIIQIDEQTPISQFAPLALGVIQGASNSHNGAPDGSENPAIDNPWNFFGSTGMSQTTSPIQILSDDGAGNVTLDFSGWGITWNGIANIPLGGDSTVPADTGIATLTCTIDCAVGDSYVLDYAAHIQQGDLSGKGGALYVLRLEGTVSAVPVPAAAWLFGSGLLGLVGMARRHEQRDSSHHYNAT